MWFESESDVKVKLFQTINKYGDNPGKIFHIWIIDSFVITLKVS